MLQFRYNVNKIKGKLCLHTPPNVNVLEYKGHPLRRKDNPIYYGSMSDKYIAMLQVTETKKVKDMDVATKVIVQLQLTDPNLKSRDRVVKKSEKNSLYSAIDVAAVWLDRALNFK